MVRNAAQTPFSSDRHRGDVILRMDVGDSFEKQPLRAIAKNTRGPPRTLLLMAPVIEIRIATATRVPPSGPIAASSASLATREDAGEHRQRQHVQVGQIHREVKDHNEQRPHEQPHREVALRVAHLAGGVGQQVPSVVRPQHRDHRDPQRAPAAPRWSSGYGTCGAEPLPERNSTTAMPIKDPILMTVSRFCTRAPARTPRQFANDRAVISATERRVRREAAHGKQVAEVDREGRRQCGDRTGDDHEKQAPPVEERRQRPVRLAEEDVNAARPWVTRVPSSA